MIFPGFGGHECSMKVRLGYQYKTVKEIAADIEQKKLDPATIMDFHEWVHCEWTPDAAMYAFTRCVKALERLLTLRGCIRLL